MPVISSPSQRLPGGSFPVLPAWWEQPGSVQPSLFGRTIPYVNGAATTYASAATETTSTINLPTFLPGDVIYVGYSLVVNLGTLTVPAGWVEAVPQFRSSSSTGGSASSLHGVLRRIMQSGDATTLAITHLNGRFAAIAVDVQGVDLSFPEDIVATDPNATSVYPNVELPGYQPVVVNGLALAWAAIRNNTNTATTSFTPPAGFTEFGDVSTAVSALSNAAIEGSSQVLTSNNVVVGTNATASSSSGTSVNPMGSIIVVRGALPVLPPAQVFLPKRLYVPSSRQRAAMLAPVAAAPPAPPALIPFSRTAVTGKLFLPRSRMRSLPPVTAPPPMARHARGPRTVLPRRTQRQLAPPVTVVVQPSTQQQPLPRKALWWGLRPKRTQQMAPPGLAPVLASSVYSNRMIRLRALVTRRSVTQRIPAVSVPASTRRSNVRSVVGALARALAHGRTSGQAPAAQAPARRRFAPPPPRPRAAQLAPSAKPAPPVPPGRQGGRPRLASFLRTVRKLALQITGLAPQITTFPGFVFISNRNAEPITLLQAAPSVAIADARVGMVAISNADGICTVTNKAVGSVGVTNL